MYKIRTLTPHLNKISENFKALLVTGMRQVGKTTFLKSSSSKDRNYASLDNQRDLLLAKNEPELFLQSHPTPLFIDEIQYAPEIFPYLKITLDNNEQNGQIWMTGSQQFSLMKNVTESLAGRLIIMRLLGLSIYERFDKGLLQKPFLPSKNAPSILEKKDLRETYHIIWKGSFPAIVDKDDSLWRTFYDSYVQTYIERDVRSLSKIIYELSFLKFLKVIASRTGQELNIQSIARDVDIAPNTAKEWISILQTSGIIFLLPPYFANTTKRFIKKPKLYFLDTGLCAYLTDWNSPETLESGAMSGAIFETFVISEIIKSYWHNGLNPNFYYYRDNSQIEMDLLIFENNTYYPIEIKKTANPSKDHIRNFKNLSIPNYQYGHGTLICLTDAPRPINENVSAISIWDI